ncbi:hypothetical protein LLH23_09360 [bacterium]|nr:hypothetical protein [bacterium]
MNSRSLAVAIAILVIAVGAYAAQAQAPQGKELKLWGGLDSKPKIADGYAPEKVEIGLGQYKFMELRGPAAGYTLAEREVAVYNRLTEALSIGPLKPEMIRVGRVRSAPTIYVDSVRLVSVYARDAAAVGMTQEALAQSWRDNLAAVLPKLTVATSERLSGPAGAQAAASAGAAAGTYEVAVGGLLLFRLRGPDGFASLAERGQAIEAKIVRMLSYGKGKSGLAQAQALDGKWVVAYDGQQVVTVTAEDAAANKAAPEALARAWAAKLNGLLGKLKGPTAPGATQ